ncbi:MAG: hypothetical protein ACREMP_01850 [Candidatus Tyrphobacter sp.]
MRFDDDALDRAILAQPLEEPPHGLRAEILAATVYRPAPVLTVAEIVAIVSGVGILLWLALSRAVQIDAAVAGAMGYSSLFLWLGVGVAVTLWLQLLTVSQPLHIGLTRARGRTRP